MDNNFLIKQTNEIIDLFEKQKEEKYELGKKDGAIEELEKLKAEIILIRGSVAETLEDLMRMETRNDDIEIIDKRIAELKGE